jgi:serine phosphatase RsbU (regulator of sigma subunit)/PAS domain-containing protein
MARSGDTPRPGPASPGASATVVLGRVIDEQRRAEAALQARFLEHGLIDQAVGVLVARLECGPKEAFDQLLEIERRSGRDLLEVAGELVGQQVAARTRVPLDEAVPVYGRPVPSRLERAADGDELARLLLADTLAWSGALEAAVALLQPDGALELIGSAGLPLRVVSQWRRIPPLTPCLLNAVIRDQSPTWVDAAGEGSGGLLVLGPAGSGGVSPNPVHVAVPLRLGRAVIGAIEVGWPASTAFSAEVRREIAGLIESAAHAVVRARRLAGSAAAGLSTAPSQDPAALDRLREIIDVSWEPALLIGPIPDEHGPVGGLQVIAVNRAARDLLTGGYAAPDPVGRRLSESLPWAAASGAFDAFRNVLITGTPFRDTAHSYVEAGGEGRARTVSVGATRVDESLLYVALRPADDEQRGDQHAVAARLRRMAQTGSWEWDAAAGVVQWSTEALIAFGSRAVPGPTPQDRPPYQVHPDDQLEHDRLMRTLSSDGRPAQGEFRVVRPDGAVRHIRIAGEPVVGQGGAVSSVFGTVQDVTERRRAQTALEIAHIQLAAQRSRAESERQLADLLQQVIMPVEPIRVPSTAGLEIAARYRPASPGAGVGGDWYGILPLPDDRLLLTVGDIAGHGFAAATAMAQLFHALHGLARTGADSGQLLRWLNAVTCSLPTFTIASACVALYDPADRKLCMANAGHPSPVLVRGGEAAAIPRPAGPMLGVDESSGYDEETVELEAGDVLLLYTDGLIERRRHSPDENIARLLAEASYAEPDLDRYVDRILERGESDTDDDTCILAVRFN